MDRRNEEGYQIATLVVVVLTVLVCMCYALIFVNPQIALNPFKPLVPTTTPVAYALQPTWTRTATATPTNTSTPSPTPTITETPLPTLTPTKTVPPTLTRRPAPTRVVPSLAPQLPYAVSGNSCYHSGGTFIEGEVKSAGAALRGVRVVLGNEPGGAVRDSKITGAQGRNDGYYLFEIAGNRSMPGTFFVWIADDAGKVLSDPNAGRVVTNNAPGDNPGACWRAWVEFARR